MSRELSPQEQIKQNVSEFSKRYLNIEEQKIALKEDLKELKEEFNLEGVPTNVVIRVINIMKRKKKKTQSEIFEEESIEQWLSENEDIDNAISSLVAK
jgi:uncharacterized protein (UPF0335 family)